MCGKICKTAQDQKDFERLIADLFKVLDLKDAKDGFSGLPFYSLVKKRFFEEDFQNKVIRVGEALDDILQSFADDPHFQLNKNIYDIVLEVVNGDKKEAIVLLGILNSRDVLVTRYFNFLKSNNKNFIDHFGKISIVTKLISHLDRQAKGSMLDDFSFPGSMKTMDERNYYYWSSALLAQELEEMNYKASFIKRAIDIFPVSYKKLRYLEAFGFLKPDQWQADFNKRTLESVKISGVGGRFALTGSDESEAIPESDYNRFLNSLGGNDVESKRIREVLLKMDSPSKNKAYILFYDFSSSEIGLSHMKLVMDGKVYEIHRKPKENTFLRERDLISGLKDAKSGTLPTSIIEFTVDEIKKTSIRSFLETEALVGEMNYFYFNKLFNPESYNCSGIIYDALRYAGINLPAQARRHILPIFTYKLLLDNLRDSKVYTRKGFYSALFSIPNFSMFTFGKKRSARKNLQFSELMYEQLEGEQQLSNTQPLMANKRRILGTVFKDYSDTGKLPAAFNPKNGEVFELNSFLVPEEKMFHGNEDDVFNNVIVNGKKYIRYFVHPTEIENYKELASISVPDPVKWMATPSSSARTLYVKDLEGKYPVKMVKLSLSINMGGAPRIVTESHMIRSTVINSLFKDIHKDSEGKLSHSGKRWFYYPESNYSAMKGDKLSPGNITRDIPEVAKSKIVIPLFALIADRDMNDRWIDELWRYNKKLSKKEFVWTQLVQPMLELQSLMSFKNGLTSEFHQQNLQVVIDPNDRNIDGLLVKDLDSNWIDESVRVNKLNKKPIQFRNLGFKELSYHLNYNLAQQNHFASYADILRSRTIEGIFKYFLSDEDLKEILERSDNFMVKEFSEAFPEFKITKVTEFEDAWKKVHLAATTSKEKAAYDALRDSKSNKTTFMKSIEELNEVFTKAKLENENTIGTCIHAMRLFLAR